MTLLNFATFVWNENFTEDHEQASIYFYNEFARCIGWIEEPNTTAAPSQRQLYEVQSRISCDFVI